MNPILFLDIDGVLIPGRAYFMPQQTQPLVAKFDPCVVGMVNRLCRDFDCRVVIHSNWRGTEERRVAKGMAGLDAHFVAEGILPQYMHADPLCPISSSRDRWTDICGWLINHPEVKQHGKFFIIEDTAPPDNWVYAEHVVRTDFDEGLTVSQYMDIRKALGGGSILLP